MRATPALTLAILPALAGCYESHGALPCRPDALPQPTPETPAEVERLVVEPLAPERVLGGDERMGVPLVAWDGASWNVAWAERFAVLDRESAPRGPLEARSEGGHATALDVGTCTRGVTAVGARPGESVVAWLGSDGVLEGATSVAGIDADIARGAQGWWVVTDGSSAREGPRLGIFEIADGAERARMRGVWVAEGSLTSPRVVALAEGDEAGRAVVSWVDRAGIVQRTIGRGRSDAGWRVMTANVWALGAMDTALLRAHDGHERVVVAATDGAMVHVALTNPRSHGVVAGPIAVARTTARHARPGIAPLPELDAVAICVPTGPGPWGGADVIDRVEVVVIDAETGAPLARRVDDSSGSTVSAVSCAWSGRELLVASWRAGRGLVTQRMRVGAPTPIVEPW